MQVRWSWQAALSECFTAQLQEIRDAMDCNMMQYLQLAAVLASVELPGHKIASVAQYKLNLYNSCFESKCVWLLR